MALCGPGEKKKGSQEESEEGKKDVFSLEQLVHSSGGF